MNDLPSVVLHAEAPPKPAAGQPCNGCGVCCALTPCPWGRLVFRRRQGSCPALEWLEGESRYACGLVRQPTVQLSWLPRRLEGPASFLFKRWIAAGGGCDCDAETD